MLLANLGVIKGDKNPLGVNDVEVNVTFDPVWTPEMMTETGREKLGFSVKKNKKDDKEENWE